GAGREPRYLVEGDAAEGGHHRRAAAHPPRRLLRRAAERPRRQRRPALQDAHRDARPRGEDHRLLLAPPRHRRARLRAHRHRARGSPGRRRFARGAPGPHRRAVPRAHLQPSHRHRALPRSRGGAGARARRMNEPARELERRRLWKLFTAYLRLSLRGKASRAFAGRFAGTSFGLSVLLGMYAAIGLAVGLAASAHVDVLAYAPLMHGMTFVMVGLGLTAESGDALFNRAESDVLGHRPVPPRTLLVAKALALLVFTLLLALALNLPAAALGL